MKEHGFTLFEVLIVIVILAIVFYLGIINFISHQRNIVLDSTAKEIAAYLEQAQNKSIARENDKNWAFILKMAILISLNFIPLIPIMPAALLLQ